MNNNQSPTIQQQLHILLQTIILSEKELEAEYLSSSDSQTRFASALSSWDNLFKYVLLPTLNTIHERLSVFEQATQLLSTCQTKTGKLKYDAARSNVLAYKRLLSAEANMTIAEHYTSELPIVPQINEHHHRQDVLKMLIALDLRKPPVIGLYDHENRCQLTRALSARYRQAKQNQVAAAQELVAIWNSKGKYIWDIDKPIFQQTLDLLNEKEYVHPGSLAALTIKLDRARLKFWLGTEGPESARESNLLSASSNLATGLRDIRERRANKDLTPARREQFDKDQTALTKLEIQMLHLIGKTQLLNNLLQAAEASWQTALQEYASLKLLAAETPDFELPDTEAKEMETYFADKQTSDKNQPTGT